MRVEGVKDVAEMCTKLGTAVLRGCIVRKEWPNPDAEPGGMWELFYLHERRAECRGRRFIGSRGLAVSWPTPGPHLMLVQQEWLAAH